MADEAEEDLAIGIDLGTTFSCVAVYRNGKVTVIPNDEGNRITPSCVSFSESGHIVGERARLRLTMLPKHSVYCIKRLMGTWFDDQSVQNDMKYWPFSVICDNDRKPRIETDVKGCRKTYTPEDISCLILQKMKAIAEKYLDQKVTKAVVTVPAYFNQDQRQATRKAAEMAGLEVLRMINEPTAAALAYGLNKTGERNVLIYDLGGGTFDVSILSVDDGITQVLATQGDTHLGGADFDNRLSDKLLNWFNEKHPLDNEVSTDLRQTKIHRVRSACEFAKCQLSEDKKTKILIDDFHEGHDLCFAVERSQFISQNEDLFQKTITHVKQALTDANLRPDEIDDVVLVGGSTRIPRVKQILHEFFKGKKLNTSINPDEAVACGAAIQAAVLNGGNTADEEFEDFLLMDVTPLSIGISTQGGLMQAIIKRNTLIPTREVKTVTTTNENQPKIDMGLYQGERSKTEDNNFMGEFYLDDIPPAPKGVPRIDLVFEIDADGLLIATAVDCKTGKKHVVKVDQHRVKNRDQDTDRHLYEAEKYKEEDEGERRRIQARIDLESFVHWIKHIVTNHEEELNITRMLKASILEHVQDMIKWLHRNVTNDATEYQHQLSIIKETCRDLPPEYLLPGTLPGQKKKVSYLPSSDHAVALINGHVESDEEFIDVID